MSEEVMRKRLLSGKWREKMTKTDVLVIGAGPAGLSAAAYAARAGYDVIAIDQLSPGGQLLLIDEIETHLHLELQKKILSFLTTLFPNIQFIVSTHSPFILNSLENAVIYDLEKKCL